MKRHYRALLVFGLVSLGAVLSMACDQKNKGQAEAPASESVASKPSEIGVEELSKLMSGGSAVVVDANGADTRQEYGVIPGALLLTSYKDYDLGVLPASKETPVVFYCGGEKCAAAPKAADRAAAAGWKNVRVLKVGIRGWVAAGKSTMKEAKG